MSNIKKIVEEKITYKCVDCDKEYFIFTEKCYKCKQNQNLILIEKKLKENNINYEHERFWNRFKIITRIDDFHLNYNEFNKNFLQDEIYKNNGHIKRIQVENEKLEQLIKIFGDDKNE